MPAQTHHPGSARGCATLWADLNDRRAPAYNKQDVHREPGRRAATDSGPAIPAPHDRSRVRSPDRVGPPGWSSQGAGAWRIERPDVDAASPIPTSPRVGRGRLHRREVPLPRHARLDATVSLAGPLVTDVCAPVSARTVFLHARRRPKPRVSGQFLRCRNQTAVLEDPLEARKQTEQVRPGSKGKTPGSIAQEKLALSTLHAH